MPLHPTWHRAFQYILILSITTSIGFGIYEWQKSRAAVKLNQGLEDSLEQGLVGYWKMDDGSGTTATDASGNGSSGTLTNGPTWTTGQIGGAVDFDGTNDSVTISNNMIGSGETSICAWIFARSTGVSGFGRIFVSGAIGGAERTIFVMQTGPRIGISSDAGVTNLITTNTIPLNTWLHTCATRDASGSGVIYINGARENSGTTGTPVSGGTLSYIGNRGFADRAFDGKIDEVRTYNRILSADEVSRLYQTTAPTGIDTGLVGHWTFDGDDISGTTAYDRSGKGGNGTLTNGPTKSLGVSGQALSFDGTDDYVSIPHSADINFAYNQDFSVGAWVKISPTQTNTAVIILQKWSNTGGYPYAIRLLTETYGVAADRGKVYVGRYDGTNNPIVKSSAALNDNAWHHVHFVKNGSTLSLYVDGILNGTSTDTTTGTTTNGFPLRIGAEDGPTYFFTGSVDDVRIHSRALSTSEVESLYSRTKPDITNNVTQKDALSQGLVGYWKMDDGLGTTATDASGNGFGATLSGTPAWSTGQIGGALNFDGVDDYGRVTYNSILASTTHRTYSFWIKPDLNEGIGVLGALNGEEGSAYNYIYIDNNGAQLNNPIIHIERRINGVTATRSAQLASPTNQWFHFIYTYDGIYERIYLNGVKSSETAQTGSFATNTEFGLLLGEQCSSQVACPGRFKGDLDEIRAYNRALSPDEATRLYQQTLPTSIDTGLVSHFTFDGDDISGTTVYDRGRSGAHGTLTNSPTTPLGKMGQAIRTTTAGGSYVAVTDAPGFDVGGTGSWCSWFYSTANQTGINAGFSHAATASDYVSISPYISASSGTVSGYVKIGGTPYAATTPTFASGYWNNAWHHACTVFDKNLSSARLKLYIDGVLMGTHDAVNGNVDAGDQPRIGQWKSGGTFGATFQGSMDEIRVYNRALTEADIRELYDDGKEEKVNTSSTDSLERGLAGYWKLDNGSGTTATDASGNGNDMTLFNSPSWTTGNIEGGLDFFPGNSDTGAHARVLDPASGVLDFGSNDFSVSMWMNSSGFVSQGSAVNIPVNKMNTDVPAGGYRLAYASTNLMTFLIHNGTTSYSITAPTATTNDSQWHHYVGRRTGNNIYLFIDGKSVATAVAVTGSVSNTNAFSVGDDGTGFRNVDGVVDEVKVYNRSLSDDEISQLYRTTVPASPESGLIGYWPMNGMDISGTTVYDRSGMGNNGTSNGSPTKPLGKIGQAMGFDGSDDLVSVGDMSSMENQSAITVSAWIKPTVLVDFGAVFSKYASNTSDITLNEGGAGVGNNSALVASIRNGSDTYGYTATGKLSAGRWTFVSMVFDGTQTGNSNRLKIYMNGEIEPLTFNGTIPATTVANTQAALIGRTGSAFNYFNGSIDEVRTYNRALTASEIKSLYNKGR